MKTIFLAMALLTSVLSSEIANSQNIVNILHQDWSEENWINDANQSYTFDNNGYQTYYLLESWDTETNKWEESTQYNYTNYSNGTVDYYLIDYWNNGWVVYRKIQYAHYPNDSIQSITHQNRNGDNWINYYKNSYSYDENGYLSSIIDQRWESMNYWKNDGNKVYTYNTNGTVDYITDYYWSDNTWVKSAKLVYTYNTNNKVLTAKREVLSGSEWRNSFINSYSYDEEGYMTSVVYQLWDEGLNEWRNSSDKVYTYNSNRTVDNRTQYDWSFNNNWVKSYKTTYTYSPTSVYENLSDLAINVYPNPVNDILHIDYDNNTHKIEIVDVINVNGKIIKPVLSKDNSLNVSDLPIGHYFIRLSLEGRVYTIKFLKTNENL